MAAIGKSALLRSLLCEKTSEQLFSGRAKINEGQFLITSLEDVGFFPPTSRNSGSTTFTMRCLFQRIPFTPPGR